jgi:hypothetical protein
VAKEEEADQQNTEPTDYELGKIILTANIARNACLVQQKFCVDFLCRLRFLNCTNAVDASCSLGHSENGGGEATGLP